MRDKHYKTFSQRLSGENINWLFKEKKNYKSWNLFFNEIKKRYGGEPSNAKHNHKKN